MALLRAKGQLGYVPPGYVYGVANSDGDVATDTNNLMTDGGTIHPTAGLTMTVLKFIDVDDADTHDSELKGVIACAWQPEEADVDMASVFVNTGTAAGARDRAGTTFTFKVTNASTSGWLWVLHRT
jgi:hypothetical protein